MMMVPHVEAKLTVVRDALRALVGALEAENWRFTAAWENAAAEAEAMIACNISLDAVASWAMNVSRLFGAGMGSFSDTYLGDDVDRIRDELQRELWDLAETSRAAPGRELCAAAQTRARCDRATSSRSIFTIIDDLGAAVDEVLATVRREFPDDARAVELVLERCRRVGSTSAASAIEARELAGDAAGLLADRPGSLGEAIIARDNDEERYRLNEEFDALRLRMRRLATELDDAAAAPDT